MRGTVHLLTAADALTLRPLLQQVLDRELKVKMFREPLQGVDLAPVLALAAERFADGPADDEAAAGGDRASASPTTTAPPSPTPAATTSPSSRSRRVGCGAGLAR